ncbi:hypothetical protein, partial [Janthinobacterium aquaticum]|uniref:hypothetical protein n=1 Tax=Janthinobacterium sp. FT58W TaxID=2654254 RepID=UPI001D016102
MNFCFIRYSSAIRRSTSISGDGRAAYAGVCPAGYLKIDGGGTTLTVATKRLPNLRRKKTRPFLIGFFSTTNNKPDNNLLSHWLQHYHRRKVVSRSCS